jgi:hypothetical protein
MKIHKTPQFHRWARKNDLENSDLCNAALEMAQGLYEADLGSGLFKKRIARRGQGKSGGFRTMIASNREERWVFLYGFAKNDRANIDKNEEKALKQLAGDLLSTPLALIEAMTKNNELIEVDCDEKEEIPHS